MGFGDFARLCPTILTLAIKEKQPIPVFFAKKDLGESFLECPFIEVLKNKPSNKPIFTDALVSYINVVFGKHHNKYYGAHNAFHKHENMLPASIGPIRPYGLKYENPVAVFTGCHVRWAKDGTRYESQKNILDENRQHIVNVLLERGFTPIILGTELDKKRFWSKINLNGCISFLGQTKFYQAIRIINECKFFVSNDTGLYHYSSMIGKKGLVFWSDTNHAIEGSPFDHSYIRHHQSKDKSTYKQALINFIESSLPESNRLFPRY